MASCNVSRLAFLAAARARGEAPEAEMLALAQKSWDRLEPEGWRLERHELWEQSEWLPLGWLERAFEAWLEESPSMHQLERWAVTLKRLGGEAWIQAVADHLGAPVAAGQ